MFRKNKTLPLTLWLILCLNVITSAAKIYPVAIFHGLGDSCEYKGMKKFAAKIQEGLGSYSYVKCIESGAFMDSVLVGLAHQSQDACKALQSDSNFSGQKISVLGLSQGGLIARYVTENCEGIEVARLVTAGAPHMGLASLPNCKSGFACYGINKTINQLVYAEVVQETIGPASMWNNPKNQQAYLEGNQFLPYLNNQLETIQKSFQKKITKLESLMLIQFSGDTVIDPPSSAWFYYYNQNNHIVPLQDQSVYSTLGLKYLDENNKIQFVSFPGEHLQINQSEIDNYIIPSLAGTYQNVKGPIYVNEQQSKGKIYKFDGFSPDEIQSMIIERVNTLNNLLTIQQQFYSYGKLPNKETLDSAYGLVVDTANDMLNYFF